jgi:hypothetical protein
MCASVRAACDANAASSWANCGGADCGGRASATVRRNTTATAITMQTQNPMRNQREKGCGSGKTPLVVPSTAFVFTACSLKLDPYYACTTFVRGSQPASAPIGCQREEALRKDFRLMSEIGILTTVCSQCGSGSHTGSNVCMWFMPSSQ